MIEDRDDSYDASDASTTFLDTTAEVAEPNHTRKHIIYHLPLQTCSKW